MASPTKTQVKTFVRKIKTFLDQTDITRSELAEIIGINAKTLCCWLNGSRSPAEESITQFSVKMKAFQEETNKASAALENFFLAV